MHPLQCAAKSERLEKLLLHSCSAINMLSIFNVVGIISIMIIAIVIIKMIIKMIIIIMFPSKSTCPRSLLCRCSECLHRVLSSEASSVNKGFPYSIFSAFAIILQEVTALFHLFVLLASNTFCIDFDPLQTWPFMGPFEPSLYPVAPILIFTPKGFSSGVHRLYFCCC